MIANGEHSTSLNGINYYYEISGQGATAIVLPGGPGLHANYVANLGGVDEFLRLIIIHPRGSGKSSDAPDGDYSLRAFAGDVAALLDHLDSKQAILLGHSHGGMIAQRFAIDYPERVEKLILANTSSNFSTFPNSFEAALVYYGDRPWFADAYNAMKRESSREYVNGDEGGDLWLRELPLFFNEWNAKYEHLRTGGFGLPLRLASLRQFNRSEVHTMDLRMELANISAPVLVLAGRYDFICTPQMSEVIVRLIPHAQLEIFEHSSHFPYIEEPEAWKNVIRGFVLEDLR